MPFNLAFMKYRRCEGRRVRASPMQFISLSRTADIFLSPSLAHLFQRDRGRKKVCNHSDRDGFLLLWFRGSCREYLSPAKNGIQIGLDLASQALSIFLTLNSTYPLSLSSGQKFFGGKGPETFYLDRPFEMAPRSILSPSLKCIYLSNEKGGCSSLKPLTSKLFAS